MSVNWIALLQVAGATLLTTLVVVTLFVLGIRLLSNDNKPAAVASFAGCVAAVGYGLFLIVF